MYKKVYFKYLSLFSRGHPHGSPSPWGGRSSQSDYYELKPYGVPRIPWAGTRMGRSEALARISTILGSKVNSDCNVKLVYEN